MDIHMVQLAVQVLELHSQRLILPLFPLPVSCPPYTWQVLHSSDKMADVEPLKHIMTTSELNLTSNVEARIKNPPTGIPRHQLLCNVEIFAKENGLAEEIPVLSKGAIRMSLYWSASTIYVLSHNCAIVAQNPADFETLDVLDSSDQDIIRYENAHRWSHPWTLYMTIIICSVGAATQLNLALILTIYTSNTFSQRMGSNRFEWRQ